MRRENILADYPIQKIAVEHPKYPQELKNITDIPPTLYFRGTLPNWTNEKCFAIVGTRRCSDYGKEIAFSFAKELAQAGLIIVSGMARGIDTSAHQGALSANAKTIAVLGTGLNQKAIYPQENLGLAKQILKQNGCLISEFTPEIHGDRFTFPRRNRIISALSLGTLVIEAKYRSGALITAAYAKQQDKKVFAVPGSIFSQNSKGPHSLINKGAILVEKPNDILKALQLSPIQLNLNKQTGTNQAEQLILQTLMNNSLHIEKIIEQTKLPARQVFSAISLLELDNKIKNLGSNIYIICI